MRRKEQADGWLSNWENTSTVSRWCANTSQLDLQILDKIAELFDCEKRELITELGMDKKKQDIAYFVSFCIEQYKNAKHLTGAEAMRQLDEYKVLDYLSEHYEILHTQSCQWILEDIDEFIRIRKEKVYENISW